jgi:hypothetical protein
MSDPYRQTRNVLMAAVARAIAEGQSLAAACARPGLPDRSTVWGWARRHPWFADELARARLLAEVRRFAFDEALAAAFVARVAAGERVRDILADPAMPSHAVYRRWRAGQSHFAAELHRLQSIAAAEHGRRLAAAAHRPFDPALADRIYAKVVAGQPLKAVLRADPAMPSYHVVTRWRREQPGFDRLIAFAVSHQRGLSARARGGPWPALTEAIAARVLRGASLAAIGRERGMPSVHTLYAWKRTRPEFAQALAIARDARIDWIADQFEAAALQVEALEQGAPNPPTPCGENRTALRKRAWYLAWKAQERARLAAEKEEAEYWR